MALRPLLGREVSARVRLLFLSLTLMKPLSLLVLPGLLLASACDKKNEPTPAAPPPSAAAAPDGTSPAENAPAAALTANPQLEKQLKAVQTGVDLANLNKNLDIFVAQKKRLPSSLAELAADSGCPIPKLPDGVVLVIDKKSASIKAVRTQ